MKLEYIRLLMKIPIVKILCLKPSKTYSHFSNIENIYSKSAYFLSFSFSLLVPERQKAQAFSCSKLLMASR
jgi:hypothetical protein